MSRGTGSGRLKHLLFKDNRLNKGRVVLWTTKALDDSSRENTEGCDDREAVGEHGEGVDKRPADHRLCTVIQRVSGKLILGVGDSG